MKVLVLDNYDSFTYNLVHIIKELGYHTSLDVIRNDKITLEEVDAYDKILLSPGPGIPSEAGIMPELIKKYAPTKSIFGVCLGHQAIGEAFGGTLHNLEEPLHGIPKESVLTEHSDYFFKNVPNSFMGARYHSWVVNNNFEGLDLEVTATDDEAQVMALRHKEYDVRGVQFHPESVLTEHGKTMLINWLLN